MTTHTFFISDLHLSAERPDITRCLSQFLQHQAPTADALYVLGDLFEYWLGDDDRSAFNEHIGNMFRELSQKGVPIYFIHGNRDFLIRQKFAQRAGMTLLPEQTVIDLYGTPTLICHGDELCTQDIAYQKFRKKARGWWWPRLVLSLPLATRRKIAENGRKKSQQNQRQLTMEIMDVSASEVVKIMERFDVKRMIHGHTHRPAIHELSVDGQPAQRIVLGDWYDQGSMLKVSTQSLELISAQFQA
ncbi:UDP-2,3-diacylglucosamine diphosphatase [Aliiglaciecola sp. LCG003]|uniref:UDP-2,3-diacylglucosamine diphosphatase n=1 Tax=Aliiglaciecola sp. LCG003 TaxID=3053655 RepID=UPI0025734B6E|nr:UDP-2,3-diacylglucosamine diphosphatase [Aliiglaciecola sp. LCG003]WJG10644.1 UDP-2,3-diacylglucosamine diphosphatase [Aliiglaciecola sp. LCG003]